MTPLDTVARVYSKMHRRSVLIFKKDQSSFRENAAQF